MSDSSLGIYYLIPFPQLCIHESDQFRRILEICVDDNHGIAKGMIQARCNGDLMSKIPAKIQELNMWICLGLFFYYLDGPILASVIYEQVFVIYFHVTQYKVEFLQEQFYITFRKIIKRAWNTSPI